MDITLIMTMTMIKHLSTKATIKLLAAVRRQAIKDRKRYGKNPEVSRPCYESAVFYLENEVPVIREILGECFKD